MFDDARTHQLRTIPSGTANPEPEIPNQNLVAVLTSTNEIFPHGITKRGKKSSIRK